MQALKLLKDHWPQYIYIYICLIVDNVSDNQASIEEAKTYLLFLLQRRVWF